MAIFRKTAMPGTGMGLGNRTGIAGATIRPTNKIGIASKSNQMVGKIGGAKPIQPSGKISVNKIERFVGQAGKSQDTRKPSPGRIVASGKMMPKLMQHSQMSKAQSQINKKIK